ncbi:MAG: ABC transporter permease, partial [Prevotellaceae bacterium]|nr:ABC transporter permease [Prevotellaceae bacterium]
MIKHYFKVAFRNLWKYKSQTLISVIGLAVGFTCFALATLWIRYETTFDNFHKNADRIYCIKMQNPFNPSRFSRRTLYPLSGYLEATFPEIANAVPIMHLPNSIITIDEVEYKVNRIMVDSTFSNFFDIRIIEGSNEFMISGAGKMAITQKKARQIFGDENPIGKVIDELTICAVVNELPKHSNYPFDIIFALNNYDNHWYTMLGEETLVELSPNINVEVFKKKLYKHTFVKENLHFGKMTLIPLT